MRVHELLAGLSSITGSSDPSAFSSNTNRNAGVSDPAAKRYDMGVSANDRSPNSFPRHSSLTAVIVTALFGLLGIAVPTESVRAQFGTGADGAVVIGVNTTLAGVKNYTKLTVNPGITLNTAGFTVYVSDTLRNMGTITDQQSGGNGGIGGTGGVGGHGLHVAPSLGAAGIGGFPASIVGGGIGGNGGGGGGGGGGAWDNSYSMAANGGNGGKGGDGGKGGGVVTIYARYFANNGVVHANGAASPTAFAGTGGFYVDYFVFPVNLDLGGGGGGGGGRGNGGNGGTVRINYGTMVLAGTLQAIGGSGGSGAFGGSGVGQSYSDFYGTGSAEAGSGSLSNGGTGGASADGSTPSNSGNTGGAGGSGAAGAVITTAVSCCTGTTGNVNMAGIVDLADLSSLVSYLTGGGYVLPCVPEANVNSAGIVDLADLSSLVSYLTGGGYILPVCP